VWSRDDTTQMPSCSVRSSGGPRASTVQFAQEHGQGSRQMRAARAGGRAGRVITSTIAGGCITVALCPWTRIANA
jgi:hypothetical protein